LYLGAIIAISLLGLRDYSNEFIQNSQDIRVFGSALYMSKRLHPFVAIFITPKCAVMFALPQAGRNIKITHDRTISGLGSSEAFFMLGNIED
jgi:hypothetical protein